MRSSKFNPQAEFYALTDMIFNGRAYRVGSHFPKQGISRPRVELLFNQGIIGYEWQINIPAPPVVVHQDVCEEPVVEREQEKPKKVAKKKAKKKTVKKKTEDS